MSQTREQFILLDNEAGNQRFVCVSLHGQALTGLGVPEADFTIPSSGNDQLRTLRETDQRSMVRSSKMMQDRRRPRFGAEEQKPRLKSLYHFSNIAIAVFPPYNI